MNTPGVILNLGSLNVDRVLRVAHIARPGETIAARSLAESAGGKGANQSVALARAGARVAHLGQIGVDGAWLRDKLAAEGIDTRFVRQSRAPTGQAIIQVDDAGQNAIVIVAGANAEITPAEIDQALDALPEAMWLVAQNETSAVAHAIRAAKKRKLRVAFNPAPFDAQVRDYPLDLVDLLCVNETEAAAMTGATEPHAILAALARQLPNCELLLTLGPDGAMHRAADRTIHQPALRVASLDTTAAGDTFFGYYLASLERGQSPAAALETATRAAALCVTRSGAMDSIPHRGQLQESS